MASKNLIVGTGNFTLITFLALVTQLRQTTILKYGVGKTVSCSPNFGDDVGESLAGVVVGLLLLLLMAFALLLLLLRLLWLDFDRAPGMR